MQNTDDIEGHPTTPQSNGTPFDEQHPPPVFSSPGPLSPPPLPPSSPAPFGFDNTPPNSGRNTPLGNNDDDDDEDEDEYPPCRLSDMTTFVKFIRMVREATLESQFGNEELVALRDPQQNESNPEDDPYLRYSIRNFIDLLGCAQDKYTALRQNHLELNPDAPILSYDQVKRRARNLSGIVTWEHHMCVHTCVAFTGPFAGLEYCPRPDCGEPRYDQKKLQESGGLLKVPRQVCTTFPVGPQLQARWKSPKTAEKMFYRWRKTEELRQERARPTGTSHIYDDILSGDAYLSAVEDGSIGEYDTVLMLSMDGAQLHRNKKSSCWIYIWILLDLGPDERYKIRNILPGGVIPGPNAPWNTESFLFPGLAHISALQKEGLHIWDAYHRRAIISWIFLLLVLADAVAMAELSGSVGHHGRKGCRLLCGLVGRNKVRGSHYYPALQRPFGFENHRTSSHPDIDITTLPNADPVRYRQDLDEVIASRNKAERDRRRFNSGIAKPSIFDGIPRILDLPTCFAGDLMHQPVINLAALLFDLWCARPGLRDHDRSSSWPWAVLTGEVWDNQGKAVESAGKHLPTSFGRKPRNPQEKISSGYKAWEFLYYLYGLGPGVFFNVLPTPYYSHFCKLVRAIRIIYQRRISQEQLDLAHKLLLEWCIEFENLYCQRKPERLHFVRQCVHSLAHLATETHRLGPLSLSAQWTMERVIGVLGSLLAQPSNPFANLAAQAQKMAHINAMVAMWPSFEREQIDPRGSIDLGDGYLLLGPKEDAGPHYISPTEKAALDTFCSSHQDVENVDQSSLYRWGRLKLPTEQIARSRWKELERCSDMARTDRNIKVRDLISFVWLFIDMHRRSSIRTRFVSLKLNTISSKRLMGPPMLSLLSHCTPCQTTTSFPSPTALSVSASIQAQTLWWLLMSSQFFL